MIHLINIININKTFGINSDLFKTAIKATASNASILEP